MDKEKAITIMYQMSEVVKVTQPEYRTIMEAIAFLNKLEPKKEDVVPGKGD